jgi:hypothetical protein
MARRRMLIWQGLSQLDGVTPIVVLATFDTKHGAESANEKTGAMVQVYILRADMSPMDALRAGADTAICGDCSHRSVPSGGTGACYVQVAKAPQGIWQAHMRHGIGPRVSKQTIPFDASLLSGRKIRFGAYGDPAAVPLAVWSQLADIADGVTGYTHAWRYADTGFARFCMASVDDIADWPVAKAMGYRSYVVRKAGDPRPRGLVQCPASAEAGKKTVCAACMQCGGTSNGRRADITIEAHGATRKRFRSLPLSVVTA